MNKTRLFLEKVHRAPRGRLRRALRVGVVLGATLGLLAPLETEARKLNGFDISNATVPQREIRTGGPPKDGIPTLDEPEWVTPDRAGWLRSKDRVLGLSRHSEAYAYPVGIMNWHEVVNHRIGDQYVTVTYCPLCDSGMAFMAETDAAFGVSGLLYNSDVLLYDRKTESLWSQILAAAIAGPRAGERLEQIPLAHTTWNDWRTRHPGTKVLSRSTGHVRDYASDPYRAYKKSRQLNFPVAQRDRRYHPKERVIGLQIGDQFKAYPFKELSGGPDQFGDTVADTDVVVRFDEAAGRGWVEAADGAEIPTVTAFWFAWYAFHPDTAVFEGIEVPAE